MWLQVVYLGGDGESAAREGVLKWGGKGSKCVHVSLLLASQSCRKCAPLSERQGSWGVSAPAPVHWVKVATGNIKSTVLAGMQAEQAPLVPNKPPGRDASGEVWMIEGLGVDGVNYSCSESGILLRGRGLGHQ